MTDPAPHPTEPDRPEPLRFYRSFTVGPEFASALAISSFRYLLVSPAGLLRVLIVAVAIALSAFVATVQSNGPIYALTISGLGLLGFVLLIAVGTVAGFAVERGRLRARIPAGSEFAVGFREATILMRSPTDTAEVSFDKYASCEETGRFIVLRQRASRILNFLPAECFTPESLAYLKEKIGPPTTMRGKL